MSASEYPVLIAALVLSSLLWIGWYRRLIFAENFRPALAVKISLGSIPLLCLLGIWWIIGLHAAPEVRAEGGLQLLFVAVAAITLQFSSVLLLLCGLDSLTDVLERRNFAALPALVGTWLGAACYVTGANLGSGDTLSTTLWPIALGFFTHGVLCIAFFVFTSSLATIAFERSFAAGVRCGALMLANGLVLARAAAGDWVSFAATGRDFLAELPGLLLLLTTAGIIEHLLHVRTGHHPNSNFVHGIVPAAIYLVAAALLFSR